MEHGPVCWGYIDVFCYDRLGEGIYRCDKCGQMFYTTETNRDGHDVPILVEFNSEDEV